MEKSVRKIVSLLTRSDEEVERLLSERAPLTAHDCYQAAVSHFRTHCFNWHSPTVSRARLPRASQRGPALHPDPKAPALLSMEPCRRVHPG